MTDERVDGILDHLAELEKDVERGDLHRGEAALVHARIGQVRNVLKSTLTDERLTEGTQNRYIAAVAVAEAALEDRCDRHGLCPFIKETTSRMFPEHDVHCRIVGPSPREREDRFAVSPRIFTRREGDAMGIVLLEGVPPALSIEGEFGVVAHELGHLFEGVRNRIVRNRSVAHEKEHLADAAGFALLGPRFSRDLARYFARCPDPIRPLWGSHPDRSSRLGFMHSAIGKIPFGGPEWTEWAMSCFDTNSNVTTAVEPPGRKALKYLAKEHPFTKELERKSPSDGELGPIWEGDFERSTLGGFLKDAADCKPDHF